MSKPDLRSDGHISFQCWSCGRGQSLQVKYDETFSSTFPHKCDRCHKKVTIEFTEIVRFSPKVRIIIETQAWFQRLERTTP